MFKTQKEYNKEMSLIYELYNTSINCIKDKSFLDKYTCFAFYKEHKEEYQCLNIDEFLAIIYKNALGSLDNKEILTFIKTQKNIFEKVFKTCRKFLIELHKCNMFYSDMKCANILITKDGSILIGDYGSLRMYSEEPTTNLEKDFDTYTYTFMPPSDENFKAFWIKKKKNSSFKFMDDEIFSDTNIDTIYENWEPYDNISEIDVARSIDWFHFGIAMIEFIKILENPNLTPKIQEIFDEYCQKPLYI